MQERPPAVRLRQRKLRELAKRRGLATDAALAAHLGIQQSTVMRLFNGTNPPGEKTIAVLLAAFPGTTFEELFEVVAVREPKGSAA